MIWEELNLDTLRGRPPFYKSGFLFLFVAIQTESEAIETLSDFWDLLKRLHIALWENNFKNHIFCTKLTFYWLFQLELWQSLINHFFLFIVIDQWNTLISLRFTQKAQNSFYIHPLLQNNSNEGQWWPLELYFISFVLVTFYNRYRSRLTLMVTLKKSDQFSQLNSTCSGPRGPLPIC